MATMTPTPTNVTDLVAGDIFAARNGVRYVVVAAYAGGETSVTERAMGADVTSTLSAHVEYRETGARANSTLRMFAVHPRTSRVANPVNVIGRTSV
jgi:5-enolpyruvylshikimate-3-phosphate synthase